MSHLLLIPPTLLFKDESYSMELLPWPSTKMLTTSFHFFSFPPPRGPGPLNRSLCPFSNICRLLCNHKILFVSVLFFPFSFIHLQRGQLPSPNQRISPFISLTSLFSFFPFSYLWENWNIFLLLLYACLPPKWYLLFFFPQSGERSFSPFLRFFGASLRICKRF